jgi:hypothetical protein
MRQLSASGQCICCACFRGGDRRRSSQVCIMCNVSQRLRSIIDTSTARAQTAVTCPRLHITAAQRVLGTGRTPCRWYPFAYQMLRQVLRPETRPQHVLPKQQGATADLLAMLPCDTYRPHAAAAGGAGICLCMHEHSYVRSSMFTCMHKCTRRDRSPQNQSRRCKLVHKDRLAESSPWPKAQRCCCSAAPSLEQLQQRCRCVVILAILHPATPDLSDTCAVLHDAARLTHRQQVRTQLHQHMASKPLCTHMQPYRLWRCRHGISQGHATGRHCFLAPRQLPPRPSAAGQPAAAAGPWPDGVCSGAVEEHPAETCYCPTLYVLTGSVLPLW